MSPCFFNAWRVSSFEFSNVILQIVHLLLSNSSSKCLSVKNRIFLYYTNCHKGFTVWHQLWMCAFWLYFEFCWASSLGKIQIRAKRLHTIQNLVYNLESLAALITIFIGVGIGLLSKILAGNGNVLGNESQTLTLYVRGHSTINNYVDIILPFFYPLPPHQST